MLIEILQVLPYAQTNYQTAKARQTINENIFHMMAHEVKVVPLASDMSLIILVHNVSEAN